MTLLLTLVITLTVPSESDIAYIAALACGESCGMPRTAQEMVIANILYDHAEHGRDWLRTRWYAPLKPNARVETLVRSVVERLRRGERWPRYRLIGSARDRVYWLEHGYVTGEPDAQWVAHGMEVNCFGASWPVVVVEAVGCEGAMCPQ